MIVQYDEGGPSQMDNHGAQSMRYIKYDIKTIDRKCESNITNGGCRVSFCSLSCSDYVYNIVICVDKNISRRLCI